MCSLIFHIYVPVFSTSGQLNACPQLLFLPFIITALGTLTAVSALAVD